MIRSGNWTTIERLPEIPGVAKMTGNGFWLDGKFYPSSPSTAKVGKMTSCSSPNVCPAIPKASLKNRGEF